MKNLKTLQIIFEVGDAKEMTFSLVDPKDSLTKAEVDAWAQKVVEKQAIMLGGAPVSGVKEHYVKEVTITQLT